MPKHMCVSMIDSRLIRDDEFMKIQQPDDVTDEIVELGEELSNL